MSLRATDIAFEFLKNNKDAIPFKDLWEGVKTELGYDEVMAKRKKSQFYTDLSLDGRFVSLENNTWNLKTHCKYDDVAVKEEEYEDDADDEDEESSEEEIDDEMEIDEEVSEY